MKVSIETVTPEEASKLLEVNENNRPLRKAVVNQYASDMRNGNWKVNGEAIKINRLGHLVDGQHRLQAICLSGESVDMLVVRGLEEDSVKTIDAGIKRTVSDHLKFAGYKAGNLNTIAAALQILVRFKTGKLSQAKERASSSEIMYVLDQNPGLLHSEERIGSAQIIKKICPPSISVALHYLLGLKNKTASEEFFQQLIYGNNLSPNSPVLALRNKLLTMSGDGKRGYKQITYIGLIVKAFEYFVKGEEIAHLKFTNNNDIWIDIPPNTKLSQNGDVSGLGRISKAKKKA